MCATYSPRDPIGEYWRGEITLRELRVLVEGLPTDSAMHRRYPQSQGWGPGEYLQADAVDALQALFRLTLAVNSEGGKYEPGEPTPRPGDDARREEVSRQDLSRKASVLSLVSQLLPPERR